MKIGWTFLFIGLGTGMLIEITDNIYLAIAVGFIGFLVAVAANILLSKPDN